MIYKALYYSLFRSVEKLGGSNYHLRTNGLLSLILSLIFASTLLIYIKVTGNQINYPKLYIVLFVSGCFVGNFFLSGRRARKKGIFKDAEQEQENSRIGRMIALITILIALSTLTIAFVI